MASDSRHPRGAPGELRVQFEYDWSRAPLNRTWMDTRSYEERVARDKTKVEAASRPRRFPCVQEAWYSLRRRNAWRWRVATRYRCWRRLSLKPDDNVVTSVGESFDDKSRESDDDRCWEITRELEPTNTNEYRLLARDSSGCTLSLEITKHGEIEFLKGRKGICFGIIYGRAK